MHRFIAAVFIAGTLAASGVSGEEEPVSVTTFETRDGRKIEAYRFSSLGAAEARSYLINTLDGQKLIYLEKEIVARQENTVPLEKLPEQARVEVRRARAAAAAARAEAEARGKDEEKIAAVRRKELEARVVLKKISEELALARTVLSHAENLIRNTPIEIARLDAQYDAAKTELGSLGGGGGVGYGPGGFIRAGVEPRRGDYLRSVMTQVAEDKARLELGKKDAQDVVARVQETLKQLDARAAEMEKALAAAREELKEAQAKARDAVREREKAAAPEAKPAAGGVEREVTLVTLKDGSQIRATAILEDPDGRVAIKDVEGKVRFVSVLEITKREAQPAAPPVAK